MPLMDTALDLCHPAYLPACRSAVQGIAENSVLQYFSVGRSAITDVGASHLVQVGWVGCVHLTPHTLCVPPHPHLLAPTSTY